MDPDGRTRAAIEEHWRASERGDTDVPTYLVSIMESAHEHVVHETQFFADPFQAPAGRAALAEPMPGRDIATA